MHFSSTDHNIDTQPKWPFKFERCNARQKFYIFRMIFCRSSKSIKAKACQMHVRGGQKHVIRVSFFGNGSKRIYYWRKSQLRKSKHDKLIMVINTQNGVSNIMWLSIENRRKYFVVRLSFKSWDLWKLDIVSDIGFRASLSLSLQSRWHVFRYVINTVDVIFHKIILQNTEIVFALRMEGQGVLIL